MVDSEVQTKTINDEKILRISDVQKHLGISKTRAYELVKLRSFPKIQIGHRYYIPESAYMKWLEDFTKRKITL
mgnify:CR=1 FL=1